MNAERVPQPGERIRLNSGCTVTVGRLTGFVRSWTAPHDLETFEVQVDTGGVTPSRTIRVLAHPTEAHNDVPVWAEDRRREERTA